MKASFVVVTVEDRIHDLNHLLHTIRADARWASFDINILFQGSREVLRQVTLDPRTRVWCHKEKLGCHGARVQLLRQMSPYDVYVNLDDDIELGTQTNYLPAIRKALERTAGFVITAWARTPDLLAKKTPREEFKPQIMLYNGGGMAYSEKIAALMRQLPPVKTAFDCAWPITAYVNGYTNWYYYGSLTVHRVVSRGGMQTFMQDTPLHVMCAEWLRFRPAKRRRGNCNDVLIPLDADVLPAAKALHRENRKKRFGL